MVSTTLRPFYPRERPGTHCIGGWVGPRAGLDGCGKSRPPPGFNPRTVQPVASRCTDWANPAPTTTTTTTTNNNNNTCRNPEETSTHAAACGPVRFSHCSCLIGKYKRFDNHTASILRVEPNLHITYLLGSCKQYINSNYWYNLLDHTVTQTGPQYR